MSASPPNSIVEQAQRRLREVLDELRAASEAALPPLEFYRLWLAKLVEVMAADSGHAWLLDAERCRRLVAAIPVGELNDSDSQRIERELQEVLSAKRPLIEGVEARTVICYPLIAGGVVRGIARWELAVETAAARHGCMKFIDEAAIAVERHHLLSDLREANLRFIDSSDECRLASQLQVCTDTKTTAFTLAHEGRVLIGCDRLSVLVRRGRRYRVAAVSGQEGVNRRTAAVRSMERLVAQCAASDQTLIFPLAREEFDDLRTQELERYVDDNAVKRLVIAPLSEVETQPAAKAAAIPLPSAVLLAEYFGETPPRPDELRRLETAMRCGAAALRQAREYDSIALLPLWRSVGRLRRAWLAPESRRRRLLVLVAAIAALAALTFIPADYTAYCHGTLNPVERRRIFAPLDGTVARIAVAHGDRVVRGQTLIELVNTDLNQAEAEVSGRRTAAAEQLTAVERTLLDEAKRLTAEERARLSGERSRYREQLASLDRQLEVYAQRREQLSVVSPIDGEVTTWNTAELLENRPVRQGQQLLTVAAISGPWELELLVPEHRSGRVVDAARTSTGPLRVTYSPAIDPGLVREASVVEIENSAELRSDEGNTILIRASVDAADLPQRRPGAEAAAHVHCGRRAVGYVWLCDVVDFIRGRVLFRWF